jgi:hypothetical protein
MDETRLVSGLLIGIAARIPSAANMDRHFSDGA